MKKEVDNEKIRNNGSIFLIGPMGTGKTSVAHELERIFPNLIHRDVDSKEIRFEYWKKYTDYSGKTDRKIRNEQGFLGLYKYWKKYEAELVKFLLYHDDDKSIVDFGAGQTVYEDSNMLRKIQKAFGAKNNIFLILPCEDREECQKQLEERMEKRQFDDIWENPQNYSGKELSEEELRTKRVLVSKDEYILNQHFLDSVSNRSLATHIVYTNGATPEEIAKAISEVYLGKDISSDRIKIVLNKERIVHIDNKSQRGDSYGE